jgi:hypothetical protein
MKKAFILISILIIAIALLAYFILGVWGNKKSDVSAWLDTLPEEQRACVEDRVGIALLEDIQAGRVVDKTIISVVDNADCGVEWR